jgi:hypothetical protein
MSLGAIISSLKYTDMARKSLVLNVTTANFFPAALLPFDVCEANSTQFEFVTAFHRSVKNQ